MVKVEYLFVLEGVFVYFSSFFFLIFRKGDWGYLIFGVDMVDDYDVNVNFFFIYFSLFVRSFRK